MAPKRSIPTAGELAARLKGGPGEFSDWWRKFRLSKEGGDALRAFDALTRQEASEDAALCLLISMASDGFEAVRYAVQLRTAVDSGAAWRRDAADTRERLPTLADAADNLARGLRARRLGVEWALEAAMNRTRIGSLNTEYQRRLHTMWAEFFGVLADELRKPLPEVHGGPYLGRFTAGNLLYPRAIEDGRPVTTETMLAFGLAFHVRRWRLGRIHLDSWQPGQTMPRVAMPREGWQTVAAWVRAVLSCELDANQLRDRIRELPSGVGLMPWPNLTKEG